MIQGGDPTGSGSGNIGYTFKDEFNDSLRHSKKVFFPWRTEAPKPTAANFYYPQGNTLVGWQAHRFGEVVAGMDVVDTIANVETGPGDRPTTDVVMNHVEIVRNGKEARQFDAVQIMSDYFEEAKAVEEAFKNERRFGRPIYRTNQWGRRN